MDVRLISMSERPVETLLSIWYQTKIGNEDLSKFSKDGDGVVDVNVIRSILDNPTDHSELYNDMMRMLKLIMTTPSMALQRHVSLSWLLKDVPVAFREQLVRHQNGHHFWVRSSRVDDLSNSEYYLPIGLDEDQKDELRNFYNELNDKYHDLVHNKGFNPEDAKMIMPESRLHTLAWSCNLQSMKQVLARRSNWFAQEFWIEILHKLIPQLRGALESMGYNNDIVEIVMSGYGNPDYSADPTKDDYPIKLDMVEKMHGTYPQPVDPMFLVKYSKDHKVTSYPQTCEPYKVKQYFEMFRGIWGPEYVKVLDQFTDEVLSTPMSDEEIKDIVDRVLEKRS